MASETPLMAPSSGGSMAMAPAAGAGAAAAAAAGDAPPLGVVLCDRLCFSKDAAQADALRRSLLAQRSGTAVHIRNGNLPWWWLLFATSFYLPIQITFGLLSQVLVPADLAAIVGEDNKARYLGLIVTIMMVIQNCQPIFGSISDKTRTRFGRRRPYIVL